jgi:hypothetical protein
VVIDDSPVRVGLRTTNLIRGATGPIEGDWPYLWIDATYVKVHQNGRIVSVAVIIAVGVNSDGRREVLGAINVACCLSVLGGKIVGDTVVHRAALPGKIKVSTDRRQAIPGPISLLRKRVKGFVVSISPPFG